jgi:hypothetical protein
MEWWENLFCKAQKSEMLKEVDPAAKVLTYTLCVVSEPLPSFLAC